MSNFTERIDAIEGMRELVGDAAADAAIAAFRDEQLKSVKAEQFKKYNPLRIALGETFAKMFNVSDHPRLTIVLSDFDENGEDVDPSMVLSTATMDADGKTKTQYPFGGPTRKRRSRNGKTYRGAVQVIDKGHELFDKQFDGTRFLAEALGYDKGKYGYYNELRAHGHGRGKTWEYVQAIADQAKETGA